MTTSRRTTKTARWIAAGLLAAGLVAAPSAEALEQEGAAPWFGSGGLRAIPFGKPRQALKRERRREAPFIRHLYRGFLGRAPSEHEVNYWVRRLGEEIGTTGMVRSFMESDEFFIRQAYLGLLRREPDAEGRETFTRALRGGASRADVVESILLSDEFEAAVR